MVILFNILVLYIESQVHVHFFENKKISFSLLAWSNPPCGKRPNRAGAPMRPAPLPAVPAEK